MRRLRVDADFLHERRIIVIFFERSLADDPAAFHRVVLLRDCQRVSLVELLDLDSGDKSRRGRRAQLVDVEPGAIGHPERRRNLLVFLRGRSQARCRATVAERDGQRLVMLARRDENGQFHAATIGRRHLDHRISRHRIDGNVLHRFPKDRAFRIIGRSRLNVGVGHVADIAVGRHDVHAECRGRFGTEIERVVPRELGHRLGQFLEPAVVGVATVIDRAEDEVEFVFASLEWGSCCLLDSLGRARRRDSGHHSRLSPGDRESRSTGKETVVHEFVPFVVEDLPGGLLDVGKLRKGGLDCFCPVALGNPASATRSSISEIPL